MIKQLTEKLKQEKEQSLQYDFKEKYEGIAGCCPDCGDIVSYNSFFLRYFCANVECGFEANINRERIVRKKTNNQLDQKPDQTF